MAKSRKKGKPKSSRKNVLKNAKRIEQNHLILKELSSKL
jgi:hypothetical protein